MSEVSAGSPSDLTRDGWAASPYARHRCRARPGRRALRLGRRGSLGRGGTRFGLRGEEPRAVQAVASLRSYASRRLIARTRRRLEAKPRLSPPRALSPPPPVAAPPSLGASGGFGVSLDNAEYLDAATRDRELGLDGRHGRRLGPLRRQVERRAVGRPGLVRLEQVRPARRRRPRPRPLGAREPRLLPDLGAPGRDDRQVRARHGRTAQRLRRVHRGRRSPLRRPRLATGSSGTSRTCPCSGRRGRTRPTTRR